MESVGSKNSLAVDRYEGNIAVKTMIPDCLVFISKITKVIPIFCRSRAKN